MNEAKQNESTESSQQENAMNIEQIKASGTKLTLEQEEEMKLRMKYPNPQKPGGSAFIQKMLHKGSKKYFDSGDYNMAKSKIKALNGGNKPAISLNNETNLNNDSKQEINQNEQVVQPLNVELNSAPSIVVVESQLTSPTSDSDSSHDSFNNNKMMTSHIQTPTGHGTKSPLSSSVSSSNLNSSLNNPNSHFINQSMPSSLSTNSISMLSSSISSQNLSKAIPSCIIESEEISYTIPTPECLPQSRKHSIVQSKLATPRLSTS